MLMICSFVWVPTSAEHELLFSTIEPAKCFQYLLFHAVCCMGNERAGSILIVSRYVASQVCCCPVIIHIVVLVDDVVRFWTRARML